MLAAGVLGSAPDFPVRGPIMRQILFFAIAAMVIAGADQGGVVLEDVEPAPVDGMPDDAARCGVEVGEVVAERIVLLVDRDREDVTLLAPHLLVSGTEVASKIRCGNHRMGYSLFYGVWEFIYEKVLFFLF